MNIIDFDQQLFLIIKEKFSNGSSLSWVETNKVTWKLSDIIKKSSLGGFTSKEILNYLKSEDFINKGSLIRKAYEEALKADKRWFEKVAVVSEKYLEDQGPFNFSN